MKQLLLMSVLVISALPLSAKEITFDQAKTNAAAFMQIHGMEMPVSSEAKNVSGDQSNSNYYIFNDADSKGFVIVSGDDRTAQILGYSTSGAYDESTAPDALKEMLHGYTSQIRALDAMGISSDAVSTSSITPHSAIEPLIKTKWAQNAKYEIFCPEYNGKKCKPGCGAIAISQVMYYHQWPKSEISGMPGYVTAQLKIPMDSLPPITLDWNKMTQGTASADTAINLFIRYCGQSMNMDYTPSFSGTGIDQPMVAFLKKFGYDKNVRLLSSFGYSISEWDSIIYNELLNNRPVQYNGTDVSGAVGHAFVCDGYDGNGLYHFNWGWGGEYDGYYKMSVLNPKYVDPFQYSFTGFNFYVFAVVGIQAPVDEVLNPFSWEYMNINKLDDTTIYSEVMTANNCNSSYYSGLGYQNADGSYTVLKRSGPSSFDYIKNNDVSDTLYLSKLNLVKGTYIIRPISHDANHTEWKSSVSINKYIKAVIDDSGIKLTVPAISISAKSYTCSRSKVKGEKQYLEFTVQNNGDDFMGHLFFFADKTSTPSSSIYGDGASLYSGETGLFGMYFVPEERGTYNLFVSTDDKGENIIGKFTIDIAEATGIKDVDVTKGQAESAYYTIQGVGVKKPSQSGLYIHNRKKVVVK